MELNKTQKMFVVLTQDKMPVAGTLSDDPDDSINAFALCIEEFERMGYRCIPVEVTIKEIEQ